MMYWDNMEWKIKHTRIGFDRIHTILRCDLPVVYIGVNLARGYTMVIEDEYGKYGVSIGMEDIVIKSLEWKEAVPNDAGYKIDEETLNTHKDMNRSLHLYLMVKKLMTIYKSEYNIGIDEVTYGFDIVLDEKEYKALNIFSDVINKQNKLKGFLGYSAYAFAVSGNLNFVDITLSVISGRSVYGFHIEGVKSYEMASYSNSMIDIVMGMVEKGAHKFVKTYMSREIEMDIEADVKVDAEAKSEQEGTA